MSSSSTLPLNQQKNDTIEAMDFSDIILTTNSKNYKQKGRLYRLILLAIVIIIFVALSFGIYRSVAQLSKLRAGTNELNILIEASKAEKQKKQTIVDGFNSEYNKLKVELDQISNTIKNLEKEIEEVTKDNAQYEKELKELKDSA